MTGTLERGLIKKGEEAEFVGHNRAFKSVVTGEWQLKGAAFARFDAEYPPHHSSCSAQASRCSTSLWIGPRQETTWAL